MALTNTTLLSSVAITTAGVDNPIKTTLAAATTALRLHAKIVNGVKAGNPQQAVVLRYAVSPYDMTAAAAMVALQRLAGRLDLQPPAAPNQAEYESTELVDGFGTYLYIWLEHGVYATAVAVTVTLAEG